MNKIPLVLFCIAISVSDWKYNEISISDSIILIILLSLVVVKNAKITNIQITIISILIFSTLVQSLISINLYKTTMNFTIISGNVKLVLYMTFFFVFINYCKEFNYKKKLIRYVEKTTLVLIFLGFYINLSVYLNDILNHQILWTFTRNDPASYLYSGGYSNIIRMRSIFSEPANFGIYLNFVLSIFIFGRNAKERNKNIEFISIVSIICTFSFGSIITMLLIKIVDVLKNSNLRELIKSKMSYLLLIAFSFIVFYFRENIETTILLRFSNILNGDDLSATSRLLFSWQNINNIFIGNGFGNSGILYNVYAYILSDLGILFFLIYLMISFKIVKSNFWLGTIFVMINFQKGGYLGPMFWMMLILIFIYIQKNEYNEEKKYELLNSVKLQ